MAYALLWSLVTIAGCTFGGAKETVKTEVVFMEPGSVVKIATDDKIPVYYEVVDKPGEYKPKVVEKNIGGFAAMPQSVYQKLVAEHSELLELREWKKSHP